MSMTIEDFGDELLRTGDLDPVYVAVHNAGLPLDVKMRLCLSYWCFYHLGVAARMAEQTKPHKFWHMMHAAALNESRPDGSKPWPRGAERRHFRGVQSVSAVAALAQRYRTPEAAARGLLGSSEAPTFKSVSAAAQSHLGFGPWISFKIADMSERVLGLPTDFANCELGIYKDPRQGAALARFGDWRAPITNEELTETVASYVAHWRKKRAKAPPHRDRLVNVQEIETIFCKYKSHVKGHYPSGKDTAELLHGLSGGWGDLAEQLRKALVNGAKT